MTIATSSGVSARERLLRAADELFYEEGIHTVGIDRIIERAGVAKATLYSAFGSKDELVRAYLRERSIGLGVRSGAVSWAGESPHEIQIIDERPAIRDFREAPTAPQMIRLPPPPGTNPRQENHWCRSQRLSCRKTSDSGSH